MVNSSQNPINGLSSVELERLVCAQIEQAYDRVRMHQFWVRLFSGDNDPTAMADGMCLALSGGHYVRREKPTQLNLTVSVPPGASPESIA